MAENKNVVVKGFDMPEHDAKWLMKHLLEGVEYHKGLIKTFDFEGVSTEVHRKVIEANKMFIKILAESFNKDGRCFIDSFTIPLDYAVDLGERLYALEMVMRTKNSKDSDTIAESIKLIHHNIMFGDIA